MASVRIRRLTTADAGRYKALRLCSLDDAPEAFGSTLDRERRLAEDDWTRRLGNGATFVAEDDGGTWIGVASGIPDPDHAGELRLVGMWVHPSARRRGVATALVEAVLAWAAPTAVRLDVVEANGGARRLYERLGFVPTGHRIVRDRDGVEELELVRPSPPTPAGPAPPTSAPA